MKQAMFKQITIIGMGLLGGSIGMGSIQKRLGERVVAVVRRNSAIDEVNGKHAADEVTLDICEGVKNAELVIFAVPIPTIASLCETIADAVPKGAIITDVASVKCCVLKPMQEILGRRCRVVGSHPMAGSEKSGIESAEPAILENNVCILTPTKDTDPDALAQVQAFWQTLGMQTRCVAPKVHDRCVALVSHLPHVAAFAIMNTIKNVSDKPLEVLEFAGPGFRDVTRIAASSPEMWTEICIANKSILLDILKAFQRELADCVEAFEQDNTRLLRHIFSEAKVLKEESLK